MHSALVTVFDLWISIPVLVGETRSCSLIDIPDNSFLDKREREFQLSFSTDDSSEGLIFERNTAWLSVVDNDSELLQSLTLYFVTRI